MFRIALLSLILASNLMARPAVRPDSPVSVTMTVMARPTPIVAYNAVVRHIVDGDTFDVVIDVWTDTELKVRVRLYGVDTPELKAKTKVKKDRARLAKDFVTSALLDRPVLVMRVDRDSFGRTLAKVLYEKNGQWVDLGDELVKAGLAIKGYDPSRF